MGYPEGILRILLGPSEGFLADNWEGEVIGEADGSKLGASVKEV